MSLLGAEAGDFQLVDESCTVAPIAGGGDCQVTLRFAPTSAGVKSATLRVASDAPAGIDELALSASAFVISGAPAPVLAGISPDHGSAGAVVMLEGS